MQKLTQEQIDKYNKEIAFFLGLTKTDGYTLHPDGSENRYYEFTGDMRDLLSSYYIFQEDNFRYYLEFDTNWQWLMTAYVTLCRILPHNFCDIQKDKVYANGYIDLPLQQALFYVVGKTCEEYNNRSK